MADINTFEKIGDIDTSLLDKVTSTNMDGGIDGRGLDIPAPPTFDAGVDLNNSPEFRADTSKDFTQQYTSPGVQSTAPEFSSPEYDQSTDGSAKYMTEGMNSWGRLDDMTSSDNALMRNANARGMARAASRGALNSGQAGQLAELEMLNSAKDFAINDARTEAEFGRGQQEHFNSMQRDSLQAENQAKRDILGTELGIESSAAEHRFGSQDSQQEYQQNLDSAAQNAGFKAESDQWAHDLGLDSLAKSQEFQAAMTDWMHNLNVDLQERGYSQQESLQMQQIFGNMAETILGGALDVMGTPDNTWDQQKQDAVDSLWNSFVNSFGVELI